ncbi:OmpA family protein [Mucilaginibacter myungsuensis]|uniref:OmpA family protein n=1 Tax=Mucilaginibacter myungsuensis TaxID=649104 RepID=A0A929PVQ4_9SPHI|nr:OmpA family protein [Mucilaginibacter myungsuensis]MBE9660560.1 OmpA family protein [Mucilaginibacter myungsuensis]MDN3600605.1 OmpA family protein [Mucilaginibacter myungsuensis]
MRISIALIVSFFLSSALFAQTGQLSTKNKRAIEFYFRSNQAIDEKDYEKALFNLHEAIKTDEKFIEAYAQLGDIYRLQRKYKEAIPNYRRVNELNADFNRAIYLKLGEAEIFTAEYPLAKADLEKYLTYPAISEANKSYARKLILDCDFSIDALKHPVPFKPINMGETVNTADDEYMPVATADEATLIFTRKIAQNEDFYKSNKLDNKWQKAVPLPGQINTPNYNEGAQSISQDGKYLFFTGCNRPDGIGRCDIYISTKRGEQWGKPFDISPPVNTNGWESQPSLSASGRTLYFVSNRAGGLGGYDIWRSSLGDKGWDAPVNMGPNINTIYDEQSPFIHADDSTLYFCSNGWPGMGNKDLFVSRLSKSGEWGKPVNLGYPINSNGDENGLTTTANGAYAFFASNNLNGFGGYDIYTFELPPAARPRVVTYVKGIIKDARTKILLEVAVEIIDLEKNIPMYQNYSSLPEGDFLATLTSGKNYALNISKSGYLFYSDNFSLVGHEAKNPFNIVVFLEPIEVGSKTILKNIFFDTNRFDLKPESMSELNKLVSFLNINPTVKIEISGHTDDVGADQTNQTLSENRAKSVYQYVISHGIPATRLVFKGYGETQPIQPNTNDEKRAMNRRTEFKVVAK